MTMGIPFNQEVDEYLDKFKTDPTQLGYKILHNVNIPYDKDVGDNVGLFPITYLNRALMYTGHKPGYDNKTDMYIVNRVAEHFILKFPQRLPDGTFSRHYGWPGEMDKNASFVWGDDQYMGLTLLSRLAVVQKKQEYAEFVGKMTLTFLKHFTDSTDGTQYHGYNDASKDRSCCKWGRANGWGMIAHSEVLQALFAFPQLQKLFSQVCLFFIYEKIRNIFV